MTHRRLVINSFTLVILVDEVNSIIMLEFAKIALFIPGMEGMTLF